MIASVCYVPEEEPDAASGSLLSASVRLLLETAASGIGAGPASAGVAGLQAASVTISAAARRPAQTRLKISVCFCMISLCFSMKSLSF